MSRTALIYRVNVLPAVFAPCALYIAKTGTSNFYDLFLTSSDGQNAERVLTESDVDAALNIRSNIPDGILKLNSQGLVGLAQLPALAQSVAGKTGAVTLEKIDVGLGNVDNTADSAKPVSTAQAAALGVVQADAAEDATAKADTARAAAVAASAPIAHVGSGEAAHAQATPAAAGFMSAQDKAKLDATTGINTGDQTAVAGNAGTATKLQTARTINGVSFDGTGNITINAVDSTARVASSLLGAVGGVATLDASGTVPSSQLPSYVDDVLEYTNLAAFPVTGTAGKIYVALDTNKTYRWSGSVYVYITSGAVDSVAGKTGAVTLSKADVGLTNVDNTADSAKPVSTAQAAANAAVQTAAATDASTKAGAAQAAAIAASAPIAHVGTGGAAHAAATTSAAGFMSAADKTKLEQLAAGSTQSQDTIHPFLLMGA